MEAEHEKLFAEVAAILGAERNQVEREAGHLLHYRLTGENFNFYFRVCWRDSKKGNIVADVPGSWEGRFRRGGPQIGFSLNRSPESLAADIRRRWVAITQEWFRERVAEKNKVERKETVERLQVEALMDANGCGFTYEEAKRHGCGTRGDVFRGHGIEAHGYNLTCDSYHGYRIQVEVQTDAALRMIARIAGEDFRMHQKNAEGSE